MSRPDRFVGGIFLAETQEGEEEVEQEEMDGKRTL